MKRFTGDKASRALRALVVKPAASLAVSLSLVGEGKGGPKGRKARMKSLTPRQRKNLAKKAAAARWKGHEPAKGKAAKKKG